jgi:hypothetical protein
LSLTALIKDNKYKTFYINAFDTAMKKYDTFVIVFSNSLWCDHCEIWSFFEEKSTYNYQEISNTIKGWLVEHSKLEVLRPYSIEERNHYTLDEVSKLEVLIPLIMVDKKKNPLEEASKLVVLTPYIHK